MQNHSKRKFPDAYSYIHTLRHLINDVTLSAVPYQKKSIIVLNFMNHFISFHTITILQMADFLHSELKAHCLQYLLALSLSYILVTVKASSSSFFFLQARPCALASLISQQNYESLIYLCWHSQLATESRICELIISCQSVGWCWCWRWCRLQKYYTAAVAHYRI